MKKQKLLTGVRIDVKTVCVLLFASSNDLERFRRFCIEYQRSGFANTYNYWLESDSEELPSAFASVVKEPVLLQLDQQRLERMAEAIRRSKGFDEERLARQSRVPVITGTVNGAIGFPSDAIA